MGLMRPSSDLPEAASDVLAMAPAPSVFGLPLVPSLITMFVIVFGQTQAYYWAARLLGTRVLGSRLGRRLKADRLRHAQHMIERWGSGALAVLLPVPTMRSVLPVGAGLVRMSYPWFAIGSAVGAVLWTTVWILGGLAVVWSWVQVTMASPLAGAAILVAVVAAVVLLVRWHRSRHTTAAPEDEEPVG
ncbi:MAG: hypothetical protein GEV11_23060 [Streptosporangiales bacterium]|nr:hypothetical protein [Streptosporangiales bacterium]